eukprot:GHRR01025236.1.p2 GENE.GHRR01025236.1~~GHRR01025236.1.p2  ORF type:complete len:118 (+),score=37.22 GHRR01025236.1:1841-2194(+)
MDWTQRTSKRNPLSGAAADNFTNAAELTVGQKLLQALQSCETHRKEQYGSTMAAKLKEARDKLPATHAKSPQTVVSSVMAQVHQLLPDAPSKQASDAPSLTQCGFVWLHLLAREMQL